MYCPFCSSHDTKVTDSRLIHEGRQIRRRRSCPECTMRFTTYEYAELIMPRVVKRDQTRVAFDEHKLRAGMLRALEKRPVNTESVEKAIQRIFQKCRSYTDKEIHSEQIGSWVIEELKQLDDVAYVRFASVYRQFQDLNAFQDEIEKLKKQGKK